jgi:predicted negative regulator of RcsB-dependent stress response
MAFAIGCMIAMILMIGWDRVQANQANTTAICKQVQALESVIHRVVAQSDATLGQPGTAGAAYYAAHPAELAAARVAIEQEAARFVGRRC